MQQKRQLKDSFKIIPKVPPKKPLPSSPEWNAKKNHLTCRSMKHKNGVRVPLSTHPAYVRVSLTTKTSSLPLVKTQKQTTNRLAANSL
jgi:hypothetical protein